MKPLETGEIEFKIPFANGDVETISFNPNDSKFYSSLTDFELKMKEIYEEFENYAKSKEKNTKEIISKITNETNEKIKAMFDELFGNGASNAIFKYVSPTAFVKRQYYPYYFLNEFMPDVVAEMEKNNKEVAENAKIMFEHTAPYINKK